CRSIGYQQIAALVFAKRGDAQTALEQYRRFPNAGVRSESPNFSGAPVSIKINALHAGVRGTAVYVAADNGTAERMVVFGDWQGQAILRTALGWIKAVETLHCVPAVILATGAGRRL